MNAIEVSNLTKVYKLYASPKDRLKEVLSLNRRKLHHDFFALNDVSFNVAKGQTIGIIGTNGSGKSTLLHLICGVLQPTGGSIRINGRIAALLELGAGFNPEFTGRDNVYMNGALLGFTKEEMGKRFHEIEAFADIGNFVDQPVKVYSSGMLVRLAFAAAIHVDPEILVVDEALSVGDIFFQAKCFAKFQEFKDRGVTIVFVTHSVDLVTTHCDHALLLDKGTVVKLGKPKVVVDTYHHLMTSREGFTTVSGNNSQHVVQSRSSSREIEWQGLFKVNPNENRYGTKKAEILEIGVFTVDHEPVQVLERNQEYLIKVKIRHNERMPAPIVAFTFKDPKGTILCGTNTFYQNKNVEMGWLEKDDIMLVTFKQVIRLNAGGYLLSAGVAAYEGKEYKVYDRRFDYMSLEIIAYQPRPGIFDPESTIEWSRL